MKYGLSDKTVEDIQNVFIENWRVDKVELFGSRAKGNYSDGSDIDLAVKGKNVSLDDILLLGAQLDELDLPYEIDLFDYDAIKDKDVVEHIDRVGIVFYTKWREYKFSELLEEESISYGVVQPGSHTEVDSVPIIRVNNIKNGYIETEDIMKVSSSIEAKYKRTRLTGGELLVTVVGSIGECAIVPFNLRGWNVARAVSVARIKDEFDKNFIKYAFKTEDIKFQMYGNTNDTVQPTLNLSSLKNLVFKLPPLKEQKSITSILCSLDDKIDLLQRQNKTLEQLAETLFRQWFVEESKDSCEVAKLGDIAIVQNGYAFRSKDYVSFQEGNLEVLKMGHIEKGGGLRTNPKRDYVPREKKLSRWILNKNDIVMAMTDMKDNVVILGVPAIIDRSDWYVLNQRVARIYLPDNRKLANSYLLYIQLNNLESIATLQSKANSGVQVNLSTDAINDCDIIIPPMELQHKKGSAIAELYLKKENNTTQIKTITQLRDSLLPKLMNGEARVKM